MQQMKIDDQKENINNVEDLTRQPMKIEDQIMSD
jgi:hypothetical protein